MNAIIVEGADLCGKSTLVKKLANKYNLDIMHCTSKDPKDFIFYYSLMRKNNVVYDREYIGELIYPQIYNRNSNLSFEEAKTLSIIASFINVKTLVLTCDSEELLKRLNERGEEVESVRNNLININNNFVKNAIKLNVPVVDTSKVSFDSICHYIETGEVTW